MSTATERVSVIIPVYNRSDAIRLTLGSFDAQLDDPSRIEIVGPIFWSIFVFFLMVAWIWAVIGIISDIFRSPDLGGVSKGIWMLFIIVIPWLGVLVICGGRHDAAMGRCGLPPFFW